MDNPTRDLAGCVLLAAELAACGATCHLVHMHEQDAELRALAPDAVVLNYLRPGNEDLVRRMLEADIDVFLLDTEGGIYDTFDSYGTLLATDRAVCHGLAGWLCWGPGLAAHAQQRGWFLSSQIEVTGAPRFDFYVGELRRVAVEQSPASRVPSPMILVNGNFPLANPRFRTPDQELREFASEFDLGHEVVRSWQRAQGEAMARFMDLVRGLAQRFPEATVVFRPHPFERSETYGAMVGTHRNIRLEHQGSVDGWILRSVAVVQRSCTTAVEATIAGVPALSPRWIALPAAIEMPAAESVSVACPDVETLEGHVAEAIAGAGEHRARRLDHNDVIWNCFYEVDGKAHGRVADAVLRRASVHPRDKHAERCRKLVAGASPDARSWEVSLRSAAKRHLPQSVRLLARGRSIRGQAAKQFTLGQVRQMLDAVTRAKPDASLTAVVAAPARARGDYVNGSRLGRTVTIGPRS